MRAVTAKATISADHQLTMQVPSDLAPGEHQVVVVIQDELTQKRSPISFANWPAHEVGPWPDDLSLRREDMYDDSGR